MTKQEARDLEFLCDKLMSEALNTECTVSMALTGKLKVEFNGNYITFDIKGNVIITDYIKYTGYYYDIETIIHDIDMCLENHADLFTKLIWSYEHIRELEE